MIHHQLFYRVLLVAFSCISISPLAAQMSITDDLVLYLPFDETEGITAADLSGNGYDAQIFNRRTIGSNPNALEDGPLPTPDNGGASDWWFWNPSGRFGGAFAPRGIASMDGLPTAPMLPGPNGQTHAMAASNFGSNINGSAWTVSAWVQLPYEPGISASDMVFYNSYRWSTGFPDGTPDYWNFGEIDAPRIAYLAKQNAASGNRLELSYAGGGANTVADPTQTAAGDPLADLVDGTWHHLVVTADYSIDTMDPGVQDGFVYVDGELAMTASFNGSTAADFAMGAISVAHASTFGGDTSAYVDDFAVWNRLLTPDEISFLSANPVIGGSTPTGDFSGPAGTPDGLWDCFDINALTAAIAAGSADLSFDMDGDGQITLSDVIEPTNGWLAVAGGQTPGTPSGNAYLAGDANLDGVVDGQDFIAWNGSKFTNEDAWCSGDFNADGVVDGQDFIVWNGNKFTGSDQLGAVPEPTTTFMALTALAALSARRRRQVRY